MRRSRTIAMDFVRGAPPTKRSPKPNPTSSKATSMWWTSTWNTSSIRHLDTPFQNPRAEGVRHGVEPTDPGSWDDPETRRVPWRGLSGGESGPYECDHRTNGRRGRDAGRVVAR